MTVGGTGDVLSGLAAGLLAKMKPFDAALVAIYINGLAGNLAFKHAGLHIIATDLIDNLPVCDEAVRQDQTHLEVIYNSLRHTRFICVFPYQA